MISPEIFENKKMVKDSEYIITSEEGREFQISGKTLKMMYQQDIEIPNYIDNMLLTPIQQILGDKPEKPKKEKIISPEERKKLIS